MSNSPILIIAAAIIVLALVLIVLARTGRKPPETPIATVTEPSPIMPDEPLPKPGTVIAAAELAPTPTADDRPDPLTRLKGLGPKAAAALNGLGITRYAQIAAWTDADVARIDPAMGAFKGRIARDRWVEQARYLAADDVAGFEAVFGKLG